MSSGGPAYSFSRIKTFRQCPARYRYRYVDRRPEPFTSVEAYLGTCVHAVLEWVYRERDAGRRPTATAAVERLRRIWGDGWRSDVVVIRTTELPETYLESGMAMVERYVVETLPRDHSETVALEQRLSGRADGELRFTGFADRVGRTVNGRLFVVDYKTSSNGGAYPEPEGGLQAKLYAAALVDSHGVDEVLAGFHYLSSGRTMWLPVSRKASAEVWRRFGELVGEVRGAGEFPPRPGPLCAWCGFCGECPAAQVPEHLAGGLNASVSRS